MNSNSKWHTIQTFRKSFRWHLGFMLLLSQVSCFQGPASTPTPMDRSQTAAGNDATGKKKSGDPVTVMVTSAIASNYVAKFQNSQLTPTQVWNLQTTAGAYRTIGNRDPKWDDLAIEMMESYAVTRGIEKSIEMAKVERQIAVCGKKAFYAGCRDPFVHYLWMRFSPEYDPNDSGGFAAASLLHVYREIAKTKYPANRKILVLRAAVDEFKRERREIPPVLAEAEQLAAEAMEVPGINEEDAFSAVQNYICIGERLRKSHYELWLKADAMLQKRYPKTFYREVLKGVSHLDWAWEARGNDFAPAVPAEAWKLVEERVATARKSLEAAYAANPKEWRVPRYMISLMLLEETDYSELEKWFNRAKQCQLNLSGTCILKVRYLEPKWHGDTKMLEDFAKELLNDKSLSPSVLEAVSTALLTVANQYPSASEYMKRPEVWAQASAASQQLLKNYPWIRKFREDLEYWGHWAGRQAEVQKILASVDERWYEH